jgi:ATP-binding protein involved in chromosome partitioning
MSELTQSLEAALSRLPDPSGRGDLGSGGRLTMVRVADGVGTAVVDATGLSADRRAELERALRSAAIGVPGISDLRVAMTADRVERTIIAVASGKGGVGKSTCAANLALALSAEGAAVGMLDADIYGPSQPRMLGITGKPESHDGKRLEPMVNYGIQSMSAGYLVDEETPMIWRGPMVTQALEQLLRETNWRDLDYLIVDMPPGTGDIQLTLSQKVPVSGAVIITTPQDIALLDARKGLKMFEKVSVPVLGVVENMSTHVCSQCGHEEHVFGEGGGQRMADQFNIDLLGSLPLDIRIREQTDGGKPTVIADPEGALAESYRRIARRIAAKLSLQAQDYSSRFPRIVVENT